MTRQRFHQELTAYLQAEQGRMYRLAYSYMENEQDALDVVQAAVVKALTASPIRQPRCLKTWMYRIVVNTAIDSLRARKCHLPLDDCIATDSDDRARDDTALDVRQALRRLPTDLRAVVVLRYLHELELQEVADVLRMNLSTVKTRLYRALRLLGMDMEDDHG